MKNSKLNLLLAAILFTVLSSSCSAIAGIFKAGMGFGIALVVIVIVIILAIVAKAGKK
jgi:hypothetical protein